MSRPFITADGIDVAGLLKGDRFIDRIEYKGSELYSHNDTTTVIFPMIEANTQLIYDTSGILQVQIDSIAGLTSTVVTRGSNYVHLNTAANNSYAGRYMIPDDVDVVVCDTGNPSDFIYLEIQSTRIKPIQIVHLNADVPVVIYNTDDNWYSDTVTVADTVFGATGRPVIFAWQDFDATFEKVNDSGSGGSVDAFKITKHHLGDQVRQDFGSNIQGLATYIDNGGGSPEWEGDSHLLTYSEYSAIVDGARKSPYNFSSDSQSKTISTSHKANKTVAGSGYVVDTINKFYSSVTLNMPASKSVGDTYVINMLDGNGITLSGNGSNFSGIYGTVASFNDSDVSLGITWNGSTWNVEQIFDTPWGFLGISSGGVFYGSVEVVNADFNAWKGHITNTCIGQGAGQVGIITGDSNTIIGQNAGNAMTAGLDNTLIGQGAGNNISGGNTNVVVGKSALSSAANPLLAIAIGSSAMGNATDGDYCIAIGRNALLANTSGTYNLALGDQAMWANTVGGFNVGIGTSALKEKQDGDYNIGIGELALNGFTGTGTTYDSGYNIGIGPQSLFRIRGGDNNIALGFQALYANGQFQDASYNIALGYQAGYNGLGQRNICIGRSAGSSAGIAAEYNVIIGDGAAVGAGNDNCVNIGRSAGGNTEGVAIGYAAYANSSAVSVGRAAVSNATFSTSIGAWTDSVAYSVALGSYAQASGNWSTAIGGGASTVLAANASGQYGIAIGYDSNADTQDSICIGRNTNVGAADTIAIGRNSSASGLNALAIGDNAFTNATGNIALGSNTGITGGTSYHAIVIGYGGASSAAYTIGMGWNNTITAVDGIAIGRSTLAQHTNSVAFGKDSTSQWVNTFHIGDPTTPMDLYISGSMIAKASWALDSAAFTAEANKNYFVDATAAMNIDMPQTLVIGDSIIFDDFKSQSATNNITIRAFGGATLVVEGVTENLIIDVNGAMIKLTYVDPTFGWRYKVV